MMLHTLAYLFENDQWHGPVPREDRAAYAAMNARCLMDAAQGCDDPNAARDSLRAAARWQGRARECARPALRARGVELPLHHVPYEARVGDTHGRHF